MRRDNRQTRPFWLGSLLLLSFIYKMYSHSLLGDAKQNICQRARLLASFQQRRALNSIGLRREDKSRWERRAPLTPDAVKKLIQETGTKVYVQSSTKRIFSDKAYSDVSIAGIMLNIY